MEVPLFCCGFVQGRELAVVEPSIMTNYCMTISPVRSAPCAASCTGSHPPHLMLVLCPGMGVLGYGGMGVWCVPQCACACKAA